MATCGVCGGENRVEARFCHDCGAVLAPPVPGSAKGPDAKVPLPPVAAPVSAAPSIAPAAPPDRSSWLVPVIAVGALVLVVGAVVVVMLGSGDDGDQVDSGGTAATAVAPETTTDGRATVPDTDPPAAVTTPPADETTRSATLFSNRAKVRTAPNIGASEVTTLTANGAGLEVIGSNIDGWYHVRLGTTEGYLFGAFVTPPDPGLQIAETSGGDAVLLSSAGGPLGIDNESGPKVLVVDTSGPLWEVVLADGRSAFVDPATVTMVG